MGEREIKVAAIQMKATPGATKEKKVAHALSVIEKASKDGCKIILPPELCTTDYRPFYRKDPKNIDIFKSAEPVPGPTTNAVGELTKKYENYVIFPLFEKKAPGIYYNAAAIVGPDGKVVGNYRKTHVAGVQALEKMYFRQGQMFNVWETEFAPSARFSVIICHDRRYPETSRIVAMMGAEIMFCPTAAPGYAGGVHWNIVNRARSVDTGMFTVYSNRVGQEFENDYFGESMIVNPFGEVIASGGKEEDAIVTAVVELDEVDKARIAVPTLRDIRNDLYLKYYRSPKYDELL